MSYRQPALIDEWGVTFYGEAETLDGRFWWWTDACRVRHPLLPARVEAEPKYLISSVFCVSPSQHTP